MDKQALLEQVYQESFSDELEKISIDLVGLKKLQKLINKKVVRGRSVADAITLLDPDILTHTVRGGKGLSAIANSGMKPFASYKGKKIDKGIISGKIFVGKGGSIPALNQSIEKINPFLVSGQRVKVLKSGKQKEMINRVALKHELSETVVKKELPFSSHLSPAVILEESNLLASLPKKYNPTKSFYRKLREGWGESSVIRKYYPGYVHGSQKISKAGKKHVLRSFERDLKFAFGDL